MCVNIFQKPMLGIKIMIFNSILIMIFLANIMIERVISVLYNYITSKF